MIVYDQTAFRVGQLAVKSVWERTAAGRMTGMTAIEETRKAFAFDGWTVVSEGPDYAVFTFPKKVLKGITTHYDASSTVAQVNASVGADGRVQLVLKRRWLTTPTAVNRSYKRIAKQLQRAGIAGQS